MEDGRELKKRLRQECLEKRAGLSQDEVREKSERIMARLFELDEFKKANFIMFYVDFKNEVMTQDAIAKALSMGKRVAVPKTVKDEGLWAIEIKSLDDLSAGAFGILEPTKLENRVDPEELDLVIVPGVAFDRKGHRLGFGAGYYDRFLPKLRPGVKKIAVAFEVQLVDSVPAEEHDIRMDAILTEEQLISLPND